MADDQVKYSDLIAQDVQPGLTMLAEALKAVTEQIASLKTEATALKGAMSAAGTATREQQQATAQQAASVEGLSKKVKQLTEEERRLEEVRKRYKKLTDEQIERVNAFQQALRGSTQQQMAAVNAIDVETKSYNELNAMYNALKDSLNAMTIAERQNTEAGKAMTAQSARIYDTMNELQKSTGKYTLQVGKYRAAFDGLGYSFQQILREVPSALNVQQFFLAISNNIPLFMDQVKSFKDEQSKIKERMKELEDVGETMSNEYKELGNKVTSFGAKMRKSIFSWQTAIIAVVFLLRQYGDKIISWFGGLFNVTIKTTKQFKDLERATNDLTNGVNKQVSEVTTELELINNKLDSVNRGTVEWRNLVDRVNEITKSTLDYNTAMPDTIRKITEEYIKQQRILAENDIIVKKLAANEYGNAIVGSLGSGLGNFLQNSDKLSAEEMLSRLGLAGDDNADLIEDINNYKSAWRNKGWEVLKSAAENNPFVPQSTVDKLNDKLIYEETKDFIELYNKIQLRLGIIDKETAKFYEERYNANLQLLQTPTLDAYSNKNKNGKEPKDQVDDLLTLKRQLEDQIIANIENEYKRLDEEETKRHERFIQDQEAELAKLAENDPRRAVINQMIEEENRTHERKMEEIDEKRYQNLQALTQKRLADEKKAAEEEEKQEKENAKGKLKAAVDGWAQYKAKMVEEGKTRKQIVEAEVAAEIARLKLMQDLNRDVNGEIMSDEQKAKVQEWINLLERLQQTGNYGDYKPGQFMGKGGANVTNERKNYANIWEVLGIDMDNNQVSALNSVFDQAKEALNSWMDARKAAADQAKELADDEVSAAENALNREIELRNQGYANDVALREKELAKAKENQKKSIEQQQKYKEQELAINTAMEASNMAVAVANIFKQFTFPYNVLMAAAMVGAWGAAKISALNQVRTTKYREGGVMLLEGGSHESGHDVNLGIGPDGSNLRAEGGEYFAVINKRSSRKYGSQIPAVVNALNSGMFEDRYIKTSDAVGLLPQVIRADNGTAVDLSSLEGGVDALVKQGETSYNVVGDYMEIRYKNRVRRVKIG